MADPRIQIRRSSVPGKIPTAAQLSPGEFAINTYDGKVYIEQDQGGVGVGTTVIVVNPWSVGTGTNTYNTYFTAGNVGIGTTNPTSKLHVIGNANITGVVTANAFVGDGSGLTGLIAVGSGIAIQDNGSPVGTANTIDFGSNLSVTFSSGIATITASGGGGGNGTVGLTKTVTPFIATEGQTTFSVTYTPGYVDVYLNGVKLSESQYIATNGTSIVLNEGASLDDVLEIVAFSAVLGIGIATVGGTVGSGVTIITFKGSGISTVTVASGIATVNIEGGTSASSDYASFSGIATNVIGGIGSITQLQVTGISTFTNGPVFIGSGTSTGTDTQPLQVTGGAYVSGNLGIGTTNPQYKLDVGGNVNFTGSLYQNGSIFSSGAFSYCCTSNITSTNLTSHPNITSANNNFFAGCGAGSSIVGGTRNNFIGYHAGYYNTNGNYNNFFGKYAGKKNTTGSFNNFIGLAAGCGDNIGNGNNFIGYYSGHYNTSGCYNSFFGSSSGYLNTTGKFNNFLGSYSGFNNTTGSYNNFFGGYTGDSTSASYKVIIGQGYRIGAKYFDSPDTDKDTQLAIGVRTDANPSKYWIVGDENFNVGIGTTNPQAKLHVGGDAKITGILTVGNSSITLDGNNNILYVGSGITFYGNSGEIYSNGTTVGSKWVSVSSGIYTGSNVGIGTTDPTSKLYVVGDGFFSGIVTASSFSGNASSATYANTAGISTYAITAGIATYSETSGIATYASISGIATYATTAGVATALQNSRTFEITGDVIASPIGFDGTGNVSFAATIQPNSVGLGTDTTGDYVQSITGTANQITVTGGSGEGSTPVISIPSNPTLPGNVTIANDLQVNNNLNVSGNITIGGTSAYIIANDFRVKDADIVLGFTTDTNGNDVSNDTTANHGGIAIASTEGSPLIEIYNPGIGETNPATYKKIMWFKSGSFAGLNTDAWLINYGVGIGSTQFPSGTRLAAGSVQITEYDLAVVRNINASGIITASSFSGNTSSATYATTAGYASTSGIATVAQGLTGTPNIVVGIATASSFVGPLTGTATTATNLSDAANITTGTINASRLSGTYNINISGSSGYASTSGIATYSTTSGVSTSVIGGIGSITSLSVSGISTLGTVQISSGIVTATSGIVTYYGDGSKLSGVSGGVSITDDTSTNATRYVLFDDVTTGTITGVNVSSTKLTFNPSTGNLIVGGTVTANSDQKLKENVQTIENALDKVLSLRGVEYTRIDNGDKQIGVIAQEVEQIIPEVVYPKQPVPDCDTKSVAYGNLIGLLIEAIKEQNQEIKELKRKLGDL